jgi:hypothetical protein
MTAKMLEQGMRFLLGHGSCSLTKFPEAGQQRKAVALRRS